MPDLGFEWDEAKSDQVSETRGFDFGFAATAFLDPQAIHQPDKRSDYNEERFRLYGHAQGRLLIVVYTKREVQDHARWCLAQGTP